MPSTVKLICEHCKTVFDKELRYYNQSIKRNQKKFYCCHRCSTQNKVARQTVFCAQCRTSFQKTMSQLADSKSGNHFCGKSCAATYNNQHKTHGTRRSKLEIYLEGRIREEYPHLALKCNGKDAIGSELDFYFPDLRFAVELNGIFHYEPIYGEDKLERIQENDNQKLIRCYEEGIELAIIDSSSCKYLSKKAKDKYWLIMHNLIERVKERIQ